MFIEAQEVRKDTSDPAADSISEAGPHHQLETELRDTREQLQSMTEEHMDNNVLETRHQAVCDPE